MSFLTAFALAALAWIEANPVLFWMVLTAVVSLAQDQLKKRAPGVWTVMQRSGFDLLGLVRMVMPKRIPPPPPMPILPPMPPLGPVDEDEEVKK